MLDFDIGKTPKKTEFIRFLRKRFKPLIKIETERKLLEFDTWEEVIKKVVEAEIKIAF